MKFTITFMGLALAAAPVAAAPDAPADASKSAPWGIDYGVQRCTLYKQIGGPQGTLFALRIIPGSAYPEMMLVRDDWTGHDRTRKATLRFLPAGPARESEPVWVEVEGRRALTFDGLGAESLDFLAAATGLSLTHGSQRLEIPLSGTAKAIDALRRCNADLLRGWGADPDEAAKLREPATQIRRSGGLFSSSDYPIDALRRGESGTVVVRLEISAAGAVERCVVVAGSESESLDQATCSVLDKRLGFMPAIGANGERVASKQILSVNWATPAPQRYDHSGKPVD